jgi:hypothetical protein
MKNKKAWSQTVALIVAGLLSGSAMAATEYYTDENGFTQERWVDDGSSGNTDGYDSDSGKSYMGHARETVQEAWDHMNDQGKARQIQDELERQ